MSAPEQKVPRFVGICRICGTRPAEKAIPFYCVKSSELRAGAVPVYKFETPLCDACVNAKRSRRIKRYWMTSLALVIIAGVGAFLGVWSYLGKGSTGTAAGRLFGAAFLAGAAASVVLLFAGIISLAACSSKILAVQLAVKDQKRALDAAGYSGYWMAPPKNLTIRRW
jgi:hypothetical protein